MAQAKRADLIDDLIETIKSSADFVMTNKNEALAENIALEAADRMTKKWGGMSVYLPKDLNYTITARNLELYKEFNGNNHRHLVQKYDLSLQAIYQIIKREREREIKDRQKSLF